MTEGGARERVEEVLRRLREKYPEPRTALHFETPLELFVATVLSAQCTDERVNRVTRDLFRRYRTPEEYAGAEEGELEEAIRPTGFFRQKARNLRKACRVMVEEFDSRVPRTMEEMLRLPGVARKTANVVLSNAYGVVEGIAVDTHVKRVSRRLGLTEETDPEKIERDLMELLSREVWADFSHLLIFHGRETCTSRRPRCGGCVLNDLCPSAFTFD
jgi:endonuclease-3